MSSDEDKPEPKPAGPARPPPKRPTSARGFGDDDSEDPRRKNEVPKINGPPRPSKDVFYFKMLTNFPKASGKKPH